MEDGVLAQDIHSVRRRATAAVLAGVLDDAALMEALWLQQETMRGDSVSDIINFIDAVAKRHMLDNALTRRLYTDLHKAMRLPEDKLPLDPLPAMQAYRTPAGARAPQGMTFGGNQPQFVAPPAYAPPPAYAAPAYAPPPAYVPPPVPQPAPVAAPVPIPAPVPVASARALVPVEQPVVFGALMRTVLLEVQRFHSAALDEVRKDALLELERSRVPLAERPIVRDAWARGTNHFWQLDADLQVLGELVRVLHLALIQAFGKVGADQILSRAIDAAEQLPEARRYSPRRLLFLL